MKHLVLRMIWIRLPVVNCASLIELLLRKFFLLFFFKNTLICAAKLFVERCLYCITLKGERRNDFENCLSDYIKRKMTNLKINNKYEIATTQ